MSCIETDSLKKLDSREETTMREGENMEQLFQKEQEQEHISAHAHTGSKLMWIN